jgi:hypothetical protein
MTPQHQNDTPALNLLRGFGGDSRTWSGEGSYRFNVAHLLDAVMAAARFVSSRQVQGMPTAAASAPTPRGPATGRTTFTATSYGPKTGLLGESEAGAPESDNSREEERVF